MQLLALVRYPPPSDAKLRDAQREPFRSILVALEATQFDPKAIHEEMPGLIARMKSICSTDDDRQCMIEQLDDWVRWHRLGGYYLSYMFQKSMQELGVSSFVSGCLLFADAQNQFAEDLSLNSLENANTYWDAAVAQVGAQESLSKVGADLRARLRMTYGYYRSLYSPASYANINPLAENLYFEKAWIDLRRAFPELPVSPRQLDAAACERVIERCAGPEDVYCRVVARRMLGLVHGGAGDFRGCKRRVFESTRRFSECDAQLRNRSFASYARLFAYEAGFAQGGRAGADQSSCLREPPQARLLASAHARRTR
jgi:hypothetical protein